MQLADFPVDAVEPQAHLSGSGGIIHNSITLVAILSQYQEMAL